MPARAPCAPRRLPARFARFDALPQDEVQRVFLGLVDLDARTDLQVFDLLARQLAIANELADAVIHVAIARRVGIALVDQGLDHLVHAGDMAGGTRLDVRAQHVQTTFVLMHRGDHALDQRLERLAVLVGPADDLVVDVGDVTHIGHVIAALAQPAGDDVEGNHHPGVTDMAEVIDGHAAHVHAHAITFQRLERFLGLAQRVVDRQCHY